MKDLTILIQGPYFEMDNYNSNENIKKLRGAAKRKKQLFYKTQQITVIA